MATSSFMYSLKYPEIGPLSSSQVAVLSMQTEAMKKEAAASAEALAAEQAAKFAANAEAKELQRFLDDSNSALEKQRDFTQRLGTNAAKAKEDLQAALADRSELVMNNQGLTQVGGVPCLCWGPSCGWGVDLWFLWGRGGGRGSWLL